MSKKPRTAWRSVKCPFFHVDEVGKMNAIHCEGPEEGINIRLSFPYRVAFENWQKKYCKDIFGYHYCPIHKMNCEKYK